MAPKVTLADESTWHKPGCGNWVAFDALAIKPVGGAEISVALYESLPERAVKRYGNTRTYYTFRCSPLACGNTTCNPIEGPHRVTMNFTPAGQRANAGFWGTGKNPWVYECDGNTFFKWNESRTVLTWDEEVWGPGPPAGWGHE